MKKLAHKTLVIIGVFLLLQSCLKDKETEPLMETSNTKSPTINEKIQLSINIQDPKMVSNLYQKHFNYLREGKTESYKAMEIRATSELVEYISNGIANGVENIVAGAIYFKDNPQLFSITSDNIQAISLFRYENKNIRHYLYINNNNRFLEDENYQILANRLSSSYPGFIFNNVIPFNNRAGGYLYFLNSELLKSLDLISAEDGFQLKKAVLAMQRGNLATLKSYGKAPNPPGGGTGGPPTSDGCGTDPGCEHGSPWNACSDAPYSPTIQCRDGVCGFNESYTIIVNNNGLEPAELLNSFNATLAYSFRDDFLISSNLGYKYGQYFYAISNIANGHISFDHAMDVASTLPEFYVVIDKLMNPSGHETDILISQTYADELQNLINICKSYSTNSDYQMILADLENDLEYFTGLTVSEVLSFF